MKYQSSMDISGVRARCIYEVIGCFRIGFCNDTYSEEEALDGSRATVLLELVLTSRTSTVSACSSFASVRTLGVAVISCCTGLSVLEMSSAASWK